MSRRAKLQNKRRGELVNELALFAGAGGGLLGAHLLGWRTLAAVEIEPHRREVVLRRQRDALLPLFPIWDDVGSFRGEPWRGRIDVVTAGFPCQPFSLAGKRLAEDDPRNGWPSTIRIIREVGPRYALLENVPGLLAHPYFGTVLGDLAESGFDAVWDCFPASAVGAPHRRDRLWILAYSKEGGRPELRGASGIPGHADIGGAGVADAKVQSQRPGLRPDEPGGKWRRRFGHGRRQGDVADPVEIGLSNGLPGQRGGPEAGRAGQDGAATGRSGSWWATEPGLGRVAHGVAHRVDRLEAIGDGQVPLVVVRAWRTLSAII